MSSDDRPVVREDLVVMSGQIQDRISQSDKENRGLWNGVIEQIQRLNGQVTTTAIKVGGHETAIALSHERIETVARRTHDHANFFTSFQKEQQAQLLFQERLLVRLEHIEKRATEAAGTVMSIEKDLCVKTEAVEALIAEKVEELSASIHGIKQDARFDLRTVVIIVVATVGIAWATFMTLAKQAI